MFHQSGQMWDLFAPVTPTWLKVWSHPSVLGSWGREWCHHCLTQVPSALAMGLWLQPWPQVCTSELSSEMERAAVGICLTDTAAWA